MCVLEAHHPKHYITIWSGLSCAQPCAQAYGFLEFFAGEAWVSKVMRWREVPTASFDIRFHEEGQEGKVSPAMDLLSDAGFGFLW